MCGCSRSCRQARAEQILRPCSRGQSFLNFISCHILPGGQARAQPGWGVLHREDRRIEGKARSRGKDKGPLLLVTDDHRDWPLPTTDLPPHLAMSLERGLCKPRCPSARAGRPPIQFRRWDTGHGGSPRGKRNVGKGERDFALLSQLLSASFCQQPPLAPSEVPEDQPEDQPSALSHSWGRVT